jgi:hypothetical protein
MASLRRRRRLHLSPRSHPPHHPIPPILVLVLVLVLVLLLDSPLSRPHPSQRGASRWLASPNPLRAKRALRSFNEARAPLQLPLVLVLVLPLVLVLVLPLVLVLVP